MQYLSVPLLKGSSNDLFFKAVCVHLAWGEDTIADNKLKLFTTENPTMCDTREEIFLKAAISSVKNAEVEEFQEAVSQYKKFFDMDKWKINVFKAILDSIEKTQNKEYLD